MDNIKAFNESVLLILDHLFDDFPLYSTISIDDYIGLIPSTPKQPFESHQGIAGTGVYVGPPMFLWTSAARKESWDLFDWGDCQSFAETTIGRPLDKIEKEQLLRNGVRPYTRNEEEQLSEWRNLAKNHEETTADIQNKRQIFSSTLKFLVKEEFICIHEIPERPGKVIQPPDVLIDQALESLTFTLTNKGFIQLNKHFSAGKLTESSSLYERIRSYISDKSLDAVVGVSAESLISALLCG